MKFSYNWLKEYISKIPSPQKTATDLTMSIFEVEDVESIGKDWLFDIKVLSNRAHDCLAHFGIAREIAAISNLKFVEPENKFSEEKKLKIKDFLSVEVREKKLCPRYSARVVIDVKVGESPAWLQERLGVCGLRPINNIVDITNYVMLECGQPLHAFDLDKIVDQKIIVRLARPKEKIITLDEGRAERILDEKILVITDPRRVIGIAGIKGGRGTEIDSGTKRIALEAANFEPINIRKSSKALMLRTDASWRFENTPDPNLTLWALDRAATLIQQLAQGKTVSGVIDVADKKHCAWTASASHSQIESLLGIKLKPEQVLKIFTRLDLSVKKLKKSKDLFYLVTVPTRRPDLLTSEDLIEEIGRLHGYEKIPSVMPSGTILPALENEELIYLEKTRQVLLGLGYSEVYNYSFVGEREKDIYGFVQPIKISNPLSQDQRYLRPSLVVGLIKNLQENFKYLHWGSSVGFVLSELKLFEFGHVFLQSEKEVVEQKKIGGLVYLKKDKTTDSTFFELKGLIEMVFNRLGLPDIWYDDYLQQGLPTNWKNILHPARSAQIKVGDEVLGWVGEINSLVLDQAGLSDVLASAGMMQARPAIFEIDFEKIIKLINEERIYQSPSKFPAITRDLSILVEAGEKTEFVLNTIEGAAGELLQDVDLFDIFEGKDLSNERKSLSFHLIFQSSERNLSDGEIYALMEKIIKALEEKGWEVRK